jgi:hypothetical protein
MLLLSLLFGFSVTAQYTIPPPTGTECTKITQAQLKLFQKKVNELVNLATQDKATYGTTGRSPGGAIYFYQHAKTALDSITVIVNTLGTGGDANPAITSYAEAGYIMPQIANIISQLTAANWQAQISAVGNNSRFASCGREMSLKLLAEAVNLLTYSSRCYIGPYKEVPPCR